MYFLCPRFSFLEHGQSLIRGLEYSFTLYHPHRRQITYADLLPAKYLLFDLREFDGALRP